MMGTMKEHEIFQHNSFRTLYSGFYKGTMRLSDALTHGNTGIGTLDGANGELIILDGSAYHGNSLNEVKKISLEETLPYVAVWNHQIQDSFAYDTITSEDLLADLMKKFATKNSLYSLKITGTFKSVEITSKPAANTASYLEILKNQPHFLKENVKGTAVGIWSPKHLESLYGNGFHLHFLADDKTFGAHLDNFVSGTVKVEIAIIHRLEQEFAAADIDFQKMKF